MLVVAAAPPPQLSRYVSIKHFIGIQFQAAAVERWRQQAQAQHVKKRETVQVRSWGDTMYKTCCTPWFVGGSDFIYYCPSHDTNPCLWVHFSSSEQKLSPATGGGGGGGLGQLQHSALLRPGPHVRRLRHSIRRWVVRTSWYLFRWRTTPSKSYLQQPASH